MSRPLAVSALLLTLFATSAAFASPDDLRRREVEIESALVARLGDDARSIRVVAIDASHLLLIGSVELRVTEEMAKEVALSLAGVERVTNHLVAIDDKTFLDGQLLLEGKDAELELKVKRALARDAGEALARALEVEAVDGVVSLRGATPDAASRDKALATAAAVPGVVRVLDLVRTSR
jgi:osmotically-inducible protein OsmY